MAMFDVIALDADDTLWHSESLYLEAKDRFKRLLSGYASPELIERRLYETEVGNLGCYGYGIKSFILSMIETAVELTGGEIPAAEIQEIIGFGRQMLSAEVQLLEHAEEAIRELSASHKLMIITKGDLLDQGSKLARSGIGGYFQYVEVVSEKTQTTYETLLAKHTIDPQRFLMVGNSLRSDIFPVLALGGYAVYIPYHGTWAHETITDPHIQQDGYYELDNLGQLPAFVERLRANSGKIEAQ